MQTKYTIAAALLAVVLTAPDDALIQNGNQALEQGDYARALQLYQQAQETTVDPGLVAFNKATAYYHLKEYRNAESHFRMALDDAAIPEARRGKALYNLGDCLMKQADARDFKVLREAIRWFESCLDAMPEADLRKDAEYNLELAKLLWNKARAKTTQKPAPNDDDGPDKAEAAKSKMAEKKSAADSETGKGKEAKKAIPSEVKQETPELADGDKTKKPGGFAKPAPSRARVIADSDEVEPLSPEQTREALQLTARRLQHERQLNRNDRATPEKRTSLDW